MWPCAAKGWHGEDFIRQIKKSDRAVALFCYDDVLRIPARKLAEYGPREIGIEAVAALANDQPAVVLAAGPFIDLLNNFIFPARAVDLEAGVELPCYHDQLAGRDQAGKVAHVHIFGKPWDM